MKAPTIATNNLFIFYVFFRLKFQIGPLWVVVRKQGILYFLSYFRLQNLNVRCHEHEVNLATLFHIYLIKADFEAFKKDKGVVFHHDVNHYNIDGDQTLTDRAKEVMKNVCDFVMSYNFDDSDPMTDYFCTNFYLTLGVGTYKKPYKVELPKLDCKGKKPDVFKHPEGAAHKAIRQALGGAYFSFHNSQRLQGKMVLGEDSYGHSGDKYFWPLSYSSAKTAQKRMDKLEKAGIRCKLTGYNGGCIEFLGYTPETEVLLEKERQEVVIAHQKWQAKQVQTA